MRQLSHLLQMRGLKLLVLISAKSVLCRIFYRCVDWNCSDPPRVYVQTWSHLLQMRGLKLRLPLIGSRHLGRIFYRCVDWNSLQKNNNNSTQSRIFYRCVDWNYERIYRYMFYNVASFTDAWIETSYGCPKDAGRSRIFYRCVDWNYLIRCAISRVASVASFTDAWIETLFEQSVQQLYRVASFTDAWIETELQKLHWRHQGRIFYRCVDWNLFL